MNADMPPRPDVATGLAVAAAYGFLELATLLRAADNSRIAAHSGVGAGPAAGVSRGRAATA